MKIKIKKELLVEPENCPEVGVLGGEYEPATEVAEK